MSDTMTGPFTTGSVTGVVNSVVVQPGITMADFWLDSVSASRVTYMLEFAAPESVVTWDGEKVTSVADFFARYTTAEYGLSVTLHPRGDRYGLSTAAEFVTKKQ